MTRHIPPTLLLQRLNPDNGDFETVNCLEVVPYTPEGHDDCKAWLEEQSRQWHHNYPPFFGAEWRVVSPAEALRGRRRQPLKLVAA